METNATTNENIFEKAENYTRTSLELVKLRTVSASADVLSTITSRIAVGAVVAFFTLFLNIGISLWIGKELGEYYYGFFILALFYLIVAIVLHTFQHSLIKTPIGNMIISSILKDSKSDSNETDQIQN
ncbi:phage holin family protein [Flavobacterium sp.]|uniref:phage holin family protein n=1 Tax=Flavobacterium sp. TaxID=239 RepID=UPI0032640172